MKDPFSEFSKGNVICKYQMVERLGNHKRRDRVFSFMLLVWVVFWIWATTRIQYSWIPITIAFFPFLLGTILFKVVFPYRAIGLVTFQGSTITFDTNTEAKVSVDLNRLQSFQLFRSIPRTFHAKVRTAPRAYGIVIRKGEETREYHVLNEMLLTQTDEQQFMSPPPPLSVTLSILTTHFKVRFYDMKGREMDVIP